MAEYYVNQLTGDDSNSGLSAKDSFQTINAANTIVQAGDTVLIYPGIYTATETYPGTYDNMIDPNTSGTSGAMINYIGVGNVVIKGTVSKIIDLTSISYVNISNIEFSGINSSGIEGIVSLTSCSNIILEKLRFKDNTASYSIGDMGIVKLDDCSSITIRYCDFINNTVITTQSNSTGGIVVDNSGVEIFKNSFVNNVSTGTVNNVTDILFVNSAAGTTVDYNLFYNNQDFINDSVGVLVGTDTHFTSIDSNFLTDITNYPADIASSFDSWITTNVSPTNTVTGNPYFKDLANSNITLSFNSEAYKAGADSSSIGSRDRGFIYDDFSTWTLHNCFESSDGSISLGTEYNIGTALSPIIDFNNVNADIKSINLEKVEKIGAAAGYRAVVDSDGGNGRRSLELRISNTLPMTNQWLQVDENGYLGLRGRYLQIKLTLRRDGV